MKRWNGWGEPTVDYPLPESAREFLEEKLGPLTPPDDISLADAVAGVPDACAPNHRLISTDAETRLRHARGQSFPDWLALRTGRIATYPDGVAFPQNDEELQQLLDLGRRQNLILIPYGGGSSVVGHINPPPMKDDRTVLTINLRRLSRLLDLDTTNQLATFGAGISGPELEAHLRAHGYTLGHFPQSFEFSTLGGWIATRSSGQQSRGYGRIEDLFAGGVVHSPAGTLTLPSFPASAAGPDLREMVLGSEGRYGIISRATVRISHLPEREAFHAVFFPDFDSGHAAVRAMIQADLPLSMVRLSTTVETETTLKLAGHELLIGTLERLLSIRGVAEGKAMLLLGFSGRSDVVGASRKTTLDIAGSHGGIHVGRQFGNQWLKGRFHTPYLRNTLWEIGVGVDTLETAVSWRDVDRTIESIEGAIQNALTPFDERAHVFTHLSHVYPTGSSVYCTYVFRLGPDPEKTLARWQAMKAAASMAIVAIGGTISHQHGVGRDHRPYLAAEKSDLGIATLATLARHFDPQGIMNPGALVKIGNGDGESEESQR